MSHRVDIDRAAVHKGHARRVAALDPLVSVPPLEAGPNDAVLVARAGDAAVVGRVRFERHAPESEQALWGALRRVRLTPFLVGDDAEVAWDRLLNRWCASLSDLVDAGDADSAAMVTVASRDTLLARSLVGHGFAPLLNTAVRHRRDRPAAATGRERATDPRVRSATAADLDDMAALALALHRHDARFGMVTERPSSAASFRASLEEHLERSSRWCWVVDASDGRLAGLVLVDPPERSAWITPLVAVRPAAYLGYLYVRPSARLAGIGAALVATAHRALDDAGVAATLLHHALPSPLSTPFWARHGYRPLWTIWQRRPAVPAG